MHILHAELCDNSHIHITDIRRATRQTGDVCAFSKGSMSAKAGMTVMTAREFGQAAHDESLALQRQTDRTAWDLCECPVNAADNSRAKGNPPDPPALSRISTLFQL